METILWSKRWTVARGWVWKQERVCEIESALQWHEIYCQDEPDVTFKLSEKKPKE